MAAPGRTTAPTTGAATGMEPHLQGLLSDVTEQALRLMRHWGAWTTDQRHTAVAELHDRYQDTNAALMDAIRRADFPQPASATTPAGAPVGAPVGASR